MAKNTTFVPPFKSFAPTSESESIYLRPFAQRNAPQSVAALVDELTYVLEQPLLTPAEHRALYIPEFTTVPADVLARIDAGETALDPWPPPDQQPAACWEAAARADAEAHTLALWTLRCIDLVSTHAPDWNLSARTALGFYSFPLLGAAHGLWVTQGERADRLRLQLHPEHVAVLGPRKRLVDGALALPLVPVVTAMDRAGYWPRPQDDLDDLARLILDLYASAAGAVPMGGLR